MGVQPVLFEKSTFIERLQGYLPTTNPALQLNRIHLPSNVIALALSRISRGWRLLSKIGKNGWLTKILPLLPQIAEHFIKNVVATDVADVLSHAIIYLHQLWSQEVNRLKLLDQFEPDPI
jgi:hypothetical protein